MKAHNFAKAVLALIVGVVCFSACLSAQKFDLKNLDAKDWVEVGKNMGEALKPMSQDEEIQLGRSLAARLAGTFGVWKNEAWTEEINLVGRTLVPYSERPDIKYRFAILDTKDVNAYSAPGGYVFITRGLLKELNSESELAGVLGHEIAHIANKDVLREIQKSNLYKASAKVAIAGSNLSSEQEEYLGKLTDASWDTLVVKGLSKEDEFKADQDGVKNAHKLGYNEYGIYNFIKRLEPMEKQPGANVKMFFSTHPKPSDRTAQLDKYYEKKNWQDTKPDYKEQYQACKAAHPIP